MAATCDVLRQGPRFRAQHLALAPPHQAPLNPNIQRVKALVGEAGVTPKRLNVCTSCLKAARSSADPH